MGFIDSVNAFTKGVGAKAKGNYDVIALNNQIYNMEKDMRGIYRDLGEQYFKLHRDDAEEAFVEYINKLKETEASIEEHKKMVEDTKAATAAVQLTVSQNNASSSIMGVPGGRVCPKCGSPVGDDPFCGVCGAKQEPLEQVAKEQDEEDIASAGKTMDSVKAYCPECGTELDCDSAFCPVCGTKIEHNN